MTSRVYKFDLLDMDNVERGESVCCGAFHCSKTTKRIIYTVILLPVIVFVILLLTVLIKALTVQERFNLMKLSDEDVTLLNPDNITKSEWAEKLAGAVKIPTVSRAVDDQNTDELLQLQQFLISQFPHVFENIRSDIVRVEIVNQYSILIRVQGQVETANPYLLCSHLDVVPVGDLSQWDLDPFNEGVVIQDEVRYIYGRGAIDDKHILIGILQALELILESEVQPVRTMYVALGHDEEVGGKLGAGELSKLLSNLLDENGEQLDFLLDEGMFVMQDVVPGIPDPVIYIGVVEKGTTYIELSVTGDQSHSSAPPKQSTIGILSKAITKLENNPSPSKFNVGPEYDSMSYLAPHATFLYKLVFSNLWLLHSALSSVLAGSPETDAIQRTTTAVTIIQAGVKENVMPGYASAIVNHRIHPTENEEDVLRHDRTVISDDRVKIESTRYMPPPPISPYGDNSIPFQIIANSALQVFPEGHVTPGTLVANTDTKHYLHLTSNVYRFSPAFITSNDTKRFHGFNERISVDNFAQVVEFYHQLMKNADTQVHNNVRVRREGL